MAEWKKIIVSGSDAHLNQITASHAYPLRFDNITGSDSTIPLVIDSNGRVTTGSAYAEQGGTDYVAQSGSFADNIAIVGAGINTIKSASSNIPVDFNGADLENIDDITLTGDISASGDIEAYRVIIDTDSAEGLIFKRSSDGNLDTGRIAYTTANNMQIRAGGSVQMISTDIQYLDNAKAHFMDGENQSKFKIFNKSANTGSGGTENNALLAIQNTSDDDMVVFHGDGRTGIGGGPDSSAMLKVYGDISGSGGITLTNLHNATGDLANFDKTVIYDSATGQLGFDSTTNVGGVTSVAGGTNINTSGTGTVTVNLDSNLASLSNVNVDGPISGSNITLEGSGSNANGMPEDNSLVRVTHVSASHLLVHESSIFEGTFLFNGLDFTVQNASTFSGSNQFGSGSQPSVVFHEFTGSVSITGSMDVTGDADFNDDVDIEGDLSVNGYTDLDNTGINGTLNVSGSVVLGDASGDTLTVAATSTFNENVKLDSANLNVDGQITGSKLQINDLPEITEFATNDAFFIVSGSNGDVSKAAFSVLSLGDISTTAGAGINIDSSTISVDSSSMAGFFASESFKNVSGDVTFDDDGDGTFTSVLNDDTVEANNIDFFDDAADDSLTDGQILVVSGSASDKKFFKRSLSGVISIDADGVTSFSSDAGIDVANEASQSYIGSASAGAHSIVLTPTTTGGVTQSLLVDGTSADLSYNTNTNVLTVDGSTFGNDVSISGNLTVAGTTTTLNTQELLIEDNFIGLNSNFIAGGTEQAAAPTKDAGIQVGRGSSTDVILAWSEDYDRWMIGLENLGNQANEFAEGDALDDTSTQAFIVTMDIETSIPDGSAEKLPNFGAATYRKGQMRIDTEGDIWMYVD